MIHDGGRLLPAILTSNAVTARGLASGMVQRPINNNSRNCTSNINFLLITTNIVLTPTKYRKNITASKINH
jgi:hypothetical protein